MYRTVCAVVVAAAMLCGGETLATTYQITTPTPIPTYLLWQHQATGGLSPWLMNGASLETLATVTPGVVSDVDS